MLRCKSDFAQVPDKQGSDNSTYFERCAGQKRFRGPLTKIKKGPRSPSAGITRETDAPVILRPLYVPRHTSLHTLLHAPRLPLDITTDVSAKNLVIIDTHVPFSRSFRHILVVSVKNRRKNDTHIPFLLFFSRNRAVSVKKCGEINTHIPFSRSFRHILVVSVKNRRKIDTHVLF